MNTQRITTAIVTFHHLEAVWVDQHSPKRTSYHADAASNASIIVDLDDLRIGISNQSVHRAYLCTGRIFALTADYRDMKPVYLPSRYLYPAQQGIADLLSFQGAGHRA
jgi:uncharacterized protein YukJ